MVTNAVAYNYARAMWHIGQTERLHWQGDFAAITAEGFHGAEELSEEKYPVFRQAVEECIELHNHLTLMGMNRTFPLQWAATLFVSRVRGEMPHGMAIPPLMLHLFMRS